MPQPNQPPVNPSQNPYAAPQSTSVAPPKMPAGAEQFAACPNCGSTYAKRVGFTWWGGVLGPRLFTHVKCASCRTAYNGKTGKSNTTAITLYIVVSFVIVFFIFGLMALAGAK